MAEQGLDFFKLPRFLVQRRGLLGVPGQLVGRGCCRQVACPLQQSRGLYAQLAIRRGQRGLLQHPQIGLTDAQEQGLLHSRVLVQKVSGQLQLAQGTGWGASALGFQQVHLGDF